MLKIFYTLLFSLSFLFLSGCSDELDITTSAVIFTRPECQRCHEAITYFETVLKAENNSLTLSIKDLSLGKNRSLLQKYARAYHIEKGTISTPVIFTPKGYIAGWDAQTSPNQLKTLLNIR